MDIGSKLEGPSRFSLTLSLSFMPGSSRTVLFSHDMGNSTQLARQMQDLLLRARCVEYHAPSNRYWHRCLCLSVPSSGAHEPLVSREPFEAESPSSPICMRLRFLCALHLSSLGPA